MHEVIADLLSARKRRAKRIWEARKWSGDMPPQKRNDMIRQLVAMEADRPMKPTADNLYEEARRLLVYSRSGHDETHHQAGEEAKEYLEAFNEVSGSSLTVDDVLMAIEAEEELVDVA